MYATPLQFKQALEGQPHVDVVGGAGSRDAIARTFEFRGTHPVPASLVTFPQPRAAATRAGSRWPDRGLGAVADFTTKSNVASCAARPVQCDAKRDARTLRRDVPRSTVTG